MVITQANLDHAKNLFNQGQLSQMYNYLASYGDRYATLANGVVEGNTLSGVAALEFMEHTAASKNIEFTQAKVDKIRLEKSPDSAAVSL